MKCGRRSSAACRLHHAADNIMHPESYSFFFFSGWIAGTARGKECNSSGQTYIFSLSFPPVTWFVAITHSSNIVLVSMDFCLHRGIISLEVQSAGDMGEERHQISLILLNIVSNALLKGYLSILYPYARILWGGLKSTSMHDKLKIILKAVNKPGSTSPTKRI